MESEKCRVLLCAIDKGSITAAAEAMGYTISGVSRMMAALEAEVGFPLLRRSREGVTPTNECCRLLPSFREMVAQAEQCRQIAGRCGVLCPARWPSAHFPAWPPTGCPI